MRQGYFPNKGKVTDVMILLLVVRIFAVKNDFFHNFSITIIRYKVMC